jgi:hypothetical protein
MAFLEMTPRMVGAALRNYVQPIVVRDNLMFFSAAIFTIGAVLCLKPAAHVVALGGVRALFLHGGVFFNAWWPLTFLIPASLSTHYWRQVKSNITTAVPHLADSEFIAALTLVALALVVLASPLICFGAPVLGSLALASIGVVMGGAISSSNPTGQTRQIGYGRSILIMPFLFLGFWPHALMFIIFAPTPATALILILAAILLITGMKFYPALAAQQNENIGHKLAFGSLRQTKPNGSNSLLRTVWLVLQWKPRFLPSMPLPSTLSMPLGPIGIFVTLLFQISVFVGIDAIEGLINGSGPLNTIITEGPRSIGLSISLSLFYSSLWMLNRHDWPFIFMAGRYGGRREFCAAMFKANCANIIQIAAFNGALAAIGGVLLGAMTLRDGPGAALVVFGIVFGMSYLVTVPLLWRELGGKGTTMAAGFVACMLANIMLSVLVMPHGPTKFALAIGAFSFLFGIAMSRIAPRRLATIDWVIETESPTSQ